MRWQIIRLFSPKCHLPFSGHLLHLNCQWAIANVHLNSPWGLFSSRWSSMFQDTLSRSRTRRSSATKGRPKMGEKPASRYKKRKKEEEERQAVYSSTDTLMTQLKQVWNDLFVPLVAGQAFLYAGRGDPLLPFNWASCEPHLGCSFKPLYASNISNHYWKKVYHNILKTKTYKNNNRYIFMYILMGMSAQSTQKGRYKCIALESYAKSAEIWLAFKG